MFAIKAKGSSATAGDLPAHRAYPFRYAAAFALDQGRHALVLEPGPGESTAIALQPALDGHRIAQTVAAAAQRLFSLPATAVEPDGAVTIGETNFLIDLERPGSKRYVVDVARPGTFILFAEHLPERFLLRLVGPSGAAHVPLWERRFPRTEAAPVDGDVK